MANLSQRLKEGFVDQYTTEEKVKTVIRVVAGIVPVILFSVMTARDIRLNFHNFTLPKAETIRTLSIITAVIFLLWLAFNTVSDQITEKRRKDNQKNSHRIVTLVAFSAVVLLIKCIGFLIIQKTGFAFAGIIPELIEIVLFGLMLFLCNMKRG